MNLRHALLCLLMALVFLAGPAAAAAPPLDEKKVLAAMKVVMYQEPCCGACPRLTPEQGRKLLSFLKGEPSPAGQALWKTYGAQLLEQLEAIDPAEARKVKNRVAAMSATARKE